MARIRRLNYAIWKLSNDPTTELAQAVAQVQSHESSSDAQAAILAIFGNILGEYSKDPEPPSHILPHVVHAFRDAEKRSLLDALRSSYGLSRLLEDKVVAAEANQKKQATKVAGYYTRLRSVDGWQDFPQCFPESMFGSHPSEKTIQALRKLAVVPGMSKERAKALLAAHHEDGDVRITQKHIHQILKTLGEDADSRQNTPESTVSASRAASISTRALPTIFEDPPETALHPAGCEPVQSIERSPLDRSKTSKRKQRHPIEIENDRLKRVRITSAAPAATQREPLALIKSPIQNTGPSPESQEQGSGQVHKVHQPRFASLPASGTSARLSLYGNPWTPTKRFRELPSPSTSASEPIWDPTTSRTSASACGQRASRLSMTLNETPLQETVPATPNLSSPKPQPGLSSSRSPEQGRGVPTGQNLDITLEDFSMSYVQIDDDTLSCAAQDDPHPSSSPSQHELDSHNPLDKGSTPPRPRLGQMIRYVAEAIVDDTEKMAKIGTRIRALNKSAKDVAEEWAQGNKEHSRLQSKAAKVQAVFAKADEELRAIMGGEDEEMLECFKGYATTAEDYKQKGARVKRRVDDAFERLLTQRHQLQTVTNDHCTGVSEDVSQGLSDLVVAIERHQQAERTHKLAVDEAEAYLASPCPESDAWADAEVI